MRRVLLALSLSALALSFLAEIPAARAGGPASEPVGQAAAASCGTLAKRLLRRTGAYRETPKDFRRFTGPVDEICHDFTGDGRRDIAFAISSGGSGAAFNFAVFRSTSDGFRKLIERSFGSKTRLRRRGRRLQVLNPVFRRGDGNCCPTGGTDVRTYRFTKTSAVYLGRKRAKP